MSVLTEKIPTNRLNVNGVTVSKAKKLDDLRLFFKTGAYSRKDIAKKLGISAVKAYTDYMVPLLDDDSIKKIENTQKYTAKEKQVSKQDLREELYNESEIMETNLFKNWRKHNKAKRESIRWVRFARICLGKVNPDFKIHPDAINRDNWQEVTANIVKAVLAVSKNKTKLHFSERQTIRHAMMYGLDSQTTMEIPKETGESLGISGEKNKPKNAHLILSRERYDEIKTILAKENTKQELAKHTIKVWTGCRPSTVYLIKTDDLKFYDREVKYVKADGKIFKKEESIELAESNLKQFRLIAELFPDKAEKILSMAPQIITETHRACTLSVFENKTQADYTKFIFDEELVKELEKYTATRKFQKKKYLFWENNDTEFIFETYDAIVKYQVLRDNTLFKNILTRVGFKKEDFGEFFRANYGYRHFAIQTWLRETDYDYDFVASMFHEDSTITKQWYGKQTAEYQQQRASEVHF